MSSRDVEYHPPDSDVLEHFAYDACRQLGEGFTDREVAEGFANFMKLTARMLAKDLNRKQPSEFDNRIE